MSQNQQKREIVLAMPGYGKMTAAASAGLWCSSRDIKSVDIRYFGGSLLACNFNKGWCHALNRVHQGERVDYFAMLHDDVGPEAFWLDKLIDELESRQLDVLGVVVPIKDTHGTTSIALHREGDNWNPECRLTMRDVFQLPETFTSDDLGGKKILLNTGCWVAKWNQDWCRQVHFEINDRIVFDKPRNCYRPEVESEDWNFSRQLHELGLKVGATRKIALLHEGEFSFANTHAWGSDIFDNQSPQRDRQTSPVPNAFPAEIPGWLHEEEGKALANLARGKRVLEIGSYCGLSTICMARTAEHVTAVDYFDGRGTPAPCDTRPAFEANLRRYGVDHKVSACHPGGPYPLEQYDLAFIDGAHDDESVRADVIHCMNLLAPGGLLAFHDFKHPSHPGVERAVDDLLLDGAELLSVTNTLAVVRPPAAVLSEV